MINLKGGSQLETHRAKDLFWLHGFWRLRGGHQGAESESHALLLRVSLPSPLPLGSYGKKGEGMQAEEEVGLLTLKIWKVWQESS